MEVTPGTTNEPAQKPAFRYHMAYDDGARKPGPTIGDSSPKCAAFLMLFVSGKRLYIASWADLCPLAACTGHHHGGRGPNTKAQRRAAIRMQLQPHT